MRQAHRRGPLRSWSLDLIQGLPGESPAHWRDQLDAAIAADGVPVVLVEQNALRALPVSVVKCFAPFFNWFLI